MEPWIYVEETFTVNVEYFAIEIMGNNNTPSMRILAAIKIMAIFI